MPCKDPWEDLLLSIQTSLPHCLSSSPCTFHPLHDSNPLYVVRFRWEGNWKSSFWREERDAVKSKGGISCAAQEELNSFTHICSSLTAPLLRSEARFRLFEIEDCWSTCNQNERLRDLTKLLRLVKYWCWAVLGGSEVTGDAGQLFEWLEGKREQILRNFLKTLLFRLA